jgi:hypothetical protein
MVDLHEIFVREKAKELEALIQPLRGFPVPLESKDLALEDGRILFESKKDSCF